MAPADDNKSYWDKVGGRYNDSWDHPVMAAMSQREVAYVASALGRTRARSVLDIGVGNGRIIDAVLEHPLVENVYGVDISDEMVRVCRKKYAHEPRVKALSVCDLSKEAVCFDEQFDLVSAVRVLKYNRDWRTVLPVVSATLRSDGLFLFTLPNRNSLNRYSRYPVPSFTATAKEIAVACARSGLRVVEITSFSKIPTRFYLLSQNLAYRDSILKMEDLLEASLGKARFGRELFVLTERSAGRS